MKSEKTTLKTVSKSLYKENKKRNYLIIFSTAVIITLLFSITSVFLGRINMEYLLGVREKGSTANVTLSHPTKKQLESIEQLPYIEYVGKETNLDTIADNASQDIISLVSTDKQTFNKVFLPAFNNFVGDLPKNSSDIIMSKKALELIGINEPHLGDELAISLKNNGVSKFKLSGYYDDYVAKSIDLPKAFTSSNSTEKNVFKENVNLSRLLIIQQSLDSNTQIEKKIYDDIETVDDTQQFVVENSKNFEAISKSIGGYSVGIGMILLIFMCSFLFIYNIFYISHQKDINRLGTLKSVGATKKQINKIQAKQIYRMLFWGTILGLILSLLINFVLIPQLLDRIYVTNYGTANTMIAFNPVVLVACLSISLLFVLFSSKAVNFKMQTMNTTSAISYTSTNKVRKNKKFTVLSYSINNVLRNKKQLIFTSLSLILGFSSILVSFVIFSGLDMTHSIDKENSDFKIVAGLPPVIQSDGIISDRRAHEPLDSEMVNKIKALNGVEKANITFATYSIVNYKNPTLEPVVKMNHRHHEYSSNDLANDFMTSITIADEKYLKKLELFLKENKMTDEYDIKNFKNGNSVFILHKNEFSPEMIENSKKLIGENITFQNLDRKEVGTIEFGGYLNRDSKKFPEINSTFISSGEPYFIISEQGFSKLKLEKEIWQLRLESNSTFDSDIKKELTTIIESRNANLTDFEQIVLVTKTDIKKAAKNYVGSIRTVSITLGIILTMFGLFNYINVFISNFFSRIKEFQILKKIGMTNKQLETMLIFEGLILSTIISTGLIIVSNIMIKIVANYLQESVDYFKYSFPTTLLVLIIACCYSICLIIPKISLRYFRKKN